MSTAAAPASRILAALTEITATSFAGGQVDRQNNVIRGVKILGPESRNGRTYTPEAMRKALSLYERARVNVNHPSKASDPRNYQDRIGMLRNVIYREGRGLFGDLHYNPKHALAAQFLYDAEFAPENVGLSHNVEAMTVRRGAKTIVESIERVVSVDIVADPATNAGLFEAIVPLAESIGPTVGELATALAEAQGKLAMAEARAALIEGGYRFGVKPSADARMLAACAALESIDDRREFAADIARRFGHASGGGVWGGFQNPTDRRREGEIVIEGRRVASKGPARPIDERDHLGRPVQAASQSLTFLRGDALDLLEARPLTVQEYLRSA